MGNFFEHISNYFSPNKKVANHLMILLIGSQLFLLLAYWTFFSNALIPKPLEIFKSLGNLITTQNLLGELWSSTMMCLKATLITILISLFISYATVMSFFKPLATLVTKMRFLTLVGLSFVFTLIAKDGGSLKIYILTFGMTVFFVTSMLDVLDSVTKNQLNHARTIGLSEWKVVWEVIILGKFDQVFDVIRQNFAMSWMMVTMVEGIVKSEGGVGTLLLNNSKYFNLDSVFAIQLLIITTGILFDFFLVVIKNTICPYAILNKEKK
jgi:NitT/TauT family transport system permease protein